MPTNHQIQFCSRTDKGKVRRINQDSLAIDQDKGFAVIADGIGGKDCGEVASEIATTACLEYFSSAEVDTLRSKATRELRNAVKYANEAIITIQQNEPKLKNMGSTLACFWIDQQTIHYSWVGDSRIYLLRPANKQIDMLSNDHTLDQSKIDPDLAPELYRRAPSILTQSVGSILLLSPDADSNKLQDGDIVLACTDGLSDRVDDQLMLEYAIQFNNDLDAYADKLLDRALDCGGQDNISFVLAKVAEQ